MKSAINAFRFTYFYAEKLVADLEDSELTTIPHPGMNHPAWILGHLVIGADFIANLLGHEMATDEDWMKKFGPGSVVESERALYPSKVELMTKLHEVYERGASFAQSATEEQLSTPNQTPFFAEQFPTIEDLLTHLLSTHPATHLGQLSAWRRCLGKPSVLGV